MTILVATEVVVRGGVDGYVGDLLIALSASGHRVELVIDPTSSSRLHEVDQALAGFVVHRVPVQHRRHTPETLRWAAVALLERTRPSGVHLVAGSPRSCLALREAAVAAGVPLVVTEQHVPETLTLSRSEAARVAASYRHARAVVFVSEGNRRTLARVVPLEGVRSVVIPNAVDVAALAATTSADRLDLDRDAPVRLMTAARLSPEKGLDDLVEAVGLLPLESWRRLDVYGDGPARDSLSELVEARGLSDRVLLHGWRTDIPQQMAVHEVFVLPSLSEGMPYALLEAMAVGIPVVATALPGTREALGEGEAGLLVPRRSPKALAAALRQVIDDPATARVRATRARERVERLYGVVSQMSRTTALWPQETVRTPSATRDDSRGHRLCKRCSSPVLPASLAAISQNASETSTGR